MFPFDKIREELMEDILGRLATMSRIKALPLVDNYSWLKMGAIGERARHGKPVLEPYGSTRNFKNFQELMFIPAQMAKIPLESNAPVNIATTIGKNAAKPLKIATPIMISGYGYGVSISKKARVALSKAAKLVGTSVNSGEGGFLKEDRENTDHYVVQYNRAHWGNTPEELKQADMIEVKIGQGAEGSTGFTDYKIGEDFREHLGIERDTYAVMPAGFPEIKKPEDFKTLVGNLRELGNGVPIAVKIAAGNIEADIDVALNAGFDAIVIDGAEGGTASSMEVTINNFGVPTLYALVRASEHLLKKGARADVSLIVSGGIRDAGDALKCLALGADAVAIGSAALVALTYHQWDEMPLGYVPTDMFLYEAPHADKLDVERAAEHLANYIKATNEEMMAMARSIGKSNIFEINKDDMIALTTEMAEITGVKLAYKTLT